MDDANNSTSELDFWLNAFTIILAFIVSILIGLLAIPVLGLSILQSILIGLIIFLVGCIIAYLTIPKKTRMNRQMEDNNRNSKTYQTEVFASKPLTKTQTGSERVIKTEIAGKPFEMGIISSPRRSQRKRKKKRASKQYY